MRAWEASNSARREQYPWLECFRYCDVSVLAEESDVLVAAAASGNLDVLVSIARWVAESPQTAVPVDLARMIEVASVYGHLDIVSWLCYENNTHWIDEFHKKERIKSGLARAATVLRHQKNDIVLSKLRTRIPIEYVAHMDQVDRISHAPPVAVASVVHSADEKTDEAKSHTERKATRAVSSLAFTALTDTGIMSTIGSFQESARNILQRFEPRGLIDLNCRFGAITRLAIILDELTSLKKVYIVATQGTSKIPERRYSFRAAMHVAAVEGRLDMLKWLHARPGDEHKCRPDTMAMAARSGWADVVEWLHLHCPESGVTMSETVINNVVRNGFVDVLRVCLKYSLGEFTPRSMQVALAAGTLEKLEGLESTATAIDSEDGTGVVYRAVRCGRVQVIEGVMTPSHTEYDGRSTVDWMVQCLQLLSPTKSSGCDVVFSSDLRSIDSSERVTLSRRVIKTSELLKAAAKRGRADLVRFLHEQCGPTLDCHHLALAMLSSTAEADATVDYILSTATSTRSSLLQQCAIDHFADVFDRGSPRGIQLLFPEIVNALSAMHRGELRCRALDDRAYTVVKTCEHAAEGDANQVKRLLSTGPRFVRRALLHCGKLSPTVLRDCLRLAISTKHVAVVDWMLAELQWDDSIFDLLERGGLYKSLSKYRARSAQGVACPP